MSSYKASKLICKQAESFLSVYQSMTSRRMADGQLCKCQRFAWMAKFILQQPARLISGFCGDDLHSSNTSFRLYSVAVITSDSDSGNPGSIPGTTFIFAFILFQYSIPPSMILPFCLSKARSAMHFRAKTEACFWKLRVIRIPS